MKSCYILTLLFVTHLALQASSALRSEEEESSYDRSPRAIHSDSEAFFSDPSDSSSGAEELSERACMERIDSPDFPGNLGLSEKAWLIEKLFYLPEHDKGPWLQAIERVYADDFPGSLSLHEKNTIAHRLALCIVSRCEPYESMRARLDCLVRIYAKDFLPHFTAQQKNTLIHNTLGLPGATQEGYRSWLSWQQDFYAENSSWGLGPEGQLEVIRCITHTTMYCKIEHVLPCLKIMSAPDFLPYLTLHEKLAEHQGLRVLKVLHEASKISPVFLRFLTKHRSFLFKPMRNSAEAVDFIRTLMFCYDTVVSPVLITPQNPTGRVFSRPEIWPTLIEYLGGTQR
ncbi:MAG: hypothetical protein H6849_03785 [Alphaproteobacteria bacterium]|nr:MAG: hypothetical protein H6849_03785 [Alphaproteobacteria bacterium]